MNSRNGKRLFRPFCGLLVCALLFSFPLSTSISANAFTDGVKSVWQWIADVTHAQADAIYDSSIVGYIFDRLTELEKAKVKEDIDSGNISVESNTLLNNAYNTYVTNINNDFGTTNFTKPNFNLNRIYFNGWTATFSELYGTFRSKETSSLFTVEFTVGSTYDYVRMNSSVITVPVTGDYNFVASSYVINGNVNNFENLGSVYSGSIGLILSIPRPPPETKVVKKTFLAGEQLQYKDLSFKTGSNGSGIISFALPYIELISEIDYTSISNINTRISNITGDTYYYGDDNSINTTTNNYFNESTGDLYNPITNETINLGDWIYDYSTRTYKDSNNDNSVTYGDSKITVNVGGNTYNYYYGSSSVDGSGGGTTDPPKEDTQSWWEKLLEKGIGGLLDGIGNVFKTIGMVIVKFIEGIINLLSMIFEKTGDFVEMVMEQVQKLPQMMGDFGQAIAGLFSWLPSDIKVAVGGAISLFLIIGIIKVLL